MLKDDSDLFLLKKNVDEDADGYTAMSASVELNLQADFFKDIIEDFFYDTHDALGPINDLFASDDSFYTMDNVLDYELLENDNYKIETFTPGIILFGFSFVTMLTATLIAKDRSSSFLIRLGTSPMKPSDFILGYTLSLIPIIILQDVLFFVVACLLGLTFTINILFTILI